VLQSATQHCAAAVAVQLMQLQLQAWPELHLAVAVRRSTDALLVAGIVKGLQSVKPDDLPMAVIRDASTGEQTVWAATLGTVLAATRGDTLSPSIIVVGQVVQLMQQPQHIDEQMCESSDRT
jgi:precorrin-4 methylase